MSQLDNLKLVAVSKPRYIPVVQMRRNKLSRKLWEQIELAKSQIDSAEFKIMKNRTFTDRESGLKKQLSVPKRLKPWWFVSEDGKVCVSIRYGSKTIELAKGKSSVEVASAEDLVKALESIKTAVEAGELDAQIEKASNSLKCGFKN